MEDFCKLEKRGNLFILTLTGNDEHRLNPTNIDSIRAALRQATTQATGPSALITTAQGKFFSNGFDLKCVGTDMLPKFQSLFSELINFPMPTIAAVTGHASGAGFLLAIAHDYLLMRKDRGFLYMSEMDTGLKFPVPVMAMINSIVSSPKTRRELVLKATKMTAEVGVERGIVDSAIDGAEATIEAAMKLGEGLVRRNWDGQVYADNRRVLFAEALSILGSETNGTVGDYRRVVKTLSKL